MRCTLRMYSEYGPLATLTVCTERTIRQLLLTVRNSATVLGMTVSLEMFHVPRRHVTLSVLRGAIKLVSALKGGKATKPASMDIDAGEALCCLFQTVV